MRFPLENSITTSLLLYLSLSFSLSSGGRMESHCCSSRSHLVNVVIILKLFFLCSHTAEISEHCQCVSCYLDQLPPSFLWGTTLHKKSEVPPVFPETYGMFIIGALRQNALYFSLMTSFFFVTTRQWDCCFFAVVFSSIWLFLNYSREFSAVALHSMRIVWMQSKQSTISCTFVSFVSDTFGVMAFTDMKQGYQSCVVTL